MVHRCPIRNFTWVQGTLDAPQGPHMRTLPCDVPYWQNVHRHGASSININRPICQANVCIPGEADRVILPRIHPTRGSQPASREDALAARLRSLRERSSNAAQPAVLEDGTGTEKEKPEGGVPGEASRAVTIQSEFGGSPRGAVSRTSSSSYRFAAPEAVIDEAAVDELLETLADEDFDLGEGEEGAESPLAGDDSGTQPEDLTRLLQSLRLGSDSLPSAREKATPGGNNGGQGGDNDDNEDDDDSDGEQMTREVEKILAQLGDEINSLPPPQSKAESQDKSDPGPAGIPANNPTPDMTTNITTDGDETTSPVALPNVPSTQPTNDDPFAPDQSIASRLAQLRGLGPLDALGLPSAPTFLPSDGGSPDNRSLLRSRTKYTDADQRGWCVVCLEDATVRCLGCGEGEEGGGGGDVYCARCWREMHVGPSAGYDERGHGWVRLDGKVGRPGVYD
ncbi:hypothetical protein VTJ49DRAFT_6103 [Mycothermus thermophilus]|uniref:Uncharacterized protein n=1 Tax=Humicola insolens TaxID=85995 RepID=A0ABR3V2C4_HUMIN